MIDPAVDIPAGARWWRRPSGTPPTVDNALTVVVPSYRRPAQLRTCLAALTREAGENDEIVVVIPAGDTESVEVARQTAPRAVIADVSPGRYAQACAVGVRSATTPLVAFMDDDALPMPGWFDAMRVQFAAPEVGGAGGPILNFLGARTSNSFFHEQQIAWVDRWGRPRSRLHEKPARHLRCHSEFLAGSNMAFRRHLIDPDEFILPGMGPAFEMLLARQVRRQGMVLLYDSSILVEHHPAPRQHLPRTDAVRGAYDLAFAMYYLSHADDRPYSHRIYWIMVGTRQAPGLVLLPFALAKGASGRWLAAHRGRAAAGRLLRRS